jgi:hypothetical protein
VFAAAGGRTDSIQLRRVAVRGQATLAVGESLIKCPFQSKRAKKKHTAIIVLSVSTFRLKSAFNDGFALGQAIPFHLDRPTVRTMQVALNAEAEYDGGRRVAMGGRVMKCPVTSIGTCSKICTAIAVIAHAPMEVGA